MKKALLFPGQGSQFIGMGKTFYDNHPKAKEIFDLADKILGFPLTELCFGGPEELLRQTENAQPALFTVSVISVMLLKEQKNFAYELVAGHSLGECSALWAAGALDLEQGLKLVRKRGEIMSRAGIKKPGAMAAVLGLENGKVVSCCREAQGAGIVEVANFNCPGQVVISGERDAVQKAIEKAKEMGASKVVPLAVSGAFHCSLLKEASAEFGEYLTSVPFKPPAQGVVSNVSADFVRTPDEIRTALKEQLSSPVRWEECIARLVQDGAGSFIEAGPGKVLTGLLRRINKTLTCVTAGEWEELVNLIQMSRL